MADEAAADAQMSLALDPPFTRPRASYGARERFRAHFRALIYPVVSELEMWTAKERLQSAQLLELLLRLLELTLGGELGRCAALFSPRAEPLLPAAASPPPGGGSLRPCARPAVAVLRARCPSGRAANGWLPLR